MKIVRLGTFETNSSSCHCLVISSELNFKKWITGTDIIAIDLNSQCGEGEYKDFKFISVDKFLEDTIAVFNENHNSKFFTPSYGYSDANGVRHDIFDKDGNWISTLDEFLFWASAEHSCLGDYLGYVPIIYIDRYKHQIKKHKNGTYEYDVNTWSW